jgi:cytochrome c5
MRVVVLWVVLALTGCGEAGSGGRSEPPLPSLAEGATDPAEVMRLWSRSCALCHVNGEGGAPRLGSIGEWQPRLAKGRDVLLAHTIEGFNNMPPLGYCMSCSRDDFERLITFMAQPQ